MPRPRAPFLLRPSRRTILLACILLLAGAIVNVAVAWVLVGAPDSVLPGRPEDLVEEGSGSAWQERVNAMVAWPSEGEPLWLGIRRQFGRSEAGAASDFESVVARLSVGWPRRSLRLDGTTTSEGWSQTSGSIQAPAWVRRDGWFQYPYDRLPLMPVPAGFAINTLFYAAILALPLGFFPIRRCLRARRGRCPKCGYDLTGVPAPGDACPECGKQR